MATQLTDAAERKRKERERMRRRGFVTVSGWVHNTDVERARKYLKRLRNRNRTT